MSDLIGKQAGKAVIWRAVQLGGVKFIFMVRLLVLAWLLTPEDFGLMAIAVTVVGFFLNVTDIGMIPALVQGVEVNEKEYNAVWTVNVLRALLISLMIVVAAPFIVQMFAEPRALNIVRVLALRPVLEAAGSIKVARLTRKLDFFPLTMIKLSEALANILVSVILAKSLGVWALVIGTLVGSVAYLAFSYIFAPHQPQLVLDWSTIRPFIRFGRWVFATSLVIMAGNYVLKVIVSRELGVAELGLYTLALQLAFLPAEIASEVIGSVAFPLFARLQAKIIQVTAMFRTTLIGMAALLFPICILIIGLAPNLVNDLLGSQWVGTVDIIRVLTFASMLGLLGEAIVPTLTGLGQPQKVTLIEIIQSVVLIVSVWLLTPRYGLIGTALAWIPAMALSHGVGSVFISRMLQRPFAHIFRPILAITLISAISTFMAMTVSSFIPGVIGLVLACFLAVLLIGSLLWLTDRRLALGLLDNVGQIFPQLAVWLGHSSAKPIAIQE